MMPSRARSIALWAITLVFGAFNVVTSVFPDLVPAGPVGIINTILLVAFALVHGTAIYGAKGIAIFAIVCLVVGNIFENLSITTGFPFGHYHYTGVLGPKLFLVPVTIGGAYFGAGYLSWTLALMLLGRAARPFDAYARWAVPVAASVLMASWDFVLDPIASTINRYWIWENGGGFFGVPFTNYLGWLLTVFLFFAAFGGYVAMRRSGDAARTPSASFWASAVVTYALLGVRYVLTYFVPSANTQFADAAGHTWMRHDIYETAALAAVFTMLAFSTLAALRLADRSR